MKDKIITYITDNGAGKVSDFISETGFTRAYIQRFFKELVDEGKLVKVGTTKSARYVLPATAEEQKKTAKEIRYRLKNISLNEDKVLDRIQHETTIFTCLSENVRRIVGFSFTEMLNNAIEHSLSPEVEVMMSLSSEKLVFEIVDRGIGIFSNIQQEKGLKSLLEAIQDLMKGKQTTMAESHTGQGIFFTSRVGDRLTITSSGYKLIFDNLIDDVFVEGSKQKIGTRIHFEIGLGSKEKIADIFKKYTSPDSFEFEKTEIRIKLFKIGSDYLSRSQARRILIGLDDFNTITLDFNKVKSIGQSFADEIFRVWKNHNPKKKLIVENANPEVSFMIKHTGEYE